MKAIKYVLSTWHVRCSWHSERERKHFVTLCDLCGYNIPYYISNIYSYVSYNIYIYQYGNSCQVFSPKVFRKLNLENAKTTSKRCSDNGCNKEVCPLPVQAGRAIVLDTTMYKGTCFPQSQQESRLGCYSIYHFFWLHVWACLGCFSTEPELRVEVQYTSEVAARFLGIRFPRGLSHLPWSRWS